jgi:cytochrome c oxidase assembly factor CtaG
MTAEASTWTLVLGAWRWRSDVVAIVVSLALVYVIGWIRLRGRHRETARPGSLMAYLGGLAAVAVALLSPLDTLGGWLFTLHMLQHQLLTVAAAPLLLLGNPVPVALWACPEALRRPLGRLLGRHGPLGAALRAVTRLPVAWLGYMIVLAGWHHPAAFQAALADARVHDAQHLSTFLAALLFWWPVINPAPRVRGHIAYWKRIIYVLGGLLAPMVPVMSLVVLASVLYPHYETVPRLWGLTVREDQATGWAVMSLADTIAYGIAFFALFGRALDEEERRVARRQGLPVIPIGRRVRRGDQV